MQTISKDAIAVYKKFDGDIDGWTRMGSAEEKRIISDELWWAIESFIQDIRLIKNGLASQNFIETTNKKLSLFVDSDSTVKLLESLV